MYYQLPLAPPPPKLPPPPEKPELLLEKLEELLDEENPLFLPDVLKDLFNLFSQGIFLPQVFMKIFATGKPIR